MVAVERSGICRDTMELVGSTLPQPRDREGSDERVGQRTNFNVVDAGLQLADEAIKD